MTAGFNRRRFIRGARNLAVGTAALSTGAHLLRPNQADAARIKPVLGRPNKPMGYKKLVTRPDLRPPNVNILTAGSGDRRAPYIFLTPTAAPGLEMPEDSQRGLMILNRRGELVWFKPMDAYMKAPASLMVHDYQGKRVLGWYQGKIENTGWGVGGNYALMDNTYSEISTVHAVGGPSDLHEFQVTDQGTALVCIYQPATDDTPVIGHAQEIDIATNDVVFEWASYPQIPVRDAYTTANRDYFHINSIDIWPGKDRDLLISARHTSTVYLIGRSDKLVRWQVGGKNSSFEMGPNTGFSFQHDARPLLDGSGFSLFDNANATSSADESSGKVLSLDFDAMTVSLRHYYRHENTQLDANSQGNMQLLPSAGHLVGWGSTPYFTEYGPSGDEVEAPVVLDGRFPDGVNSYRAYKHEWVGHPPLSELAFVVQKREDAGRFTAFASWNGATEIEAWVIKAGKAGQTLRTVGTEQKTRFEQRIGIEAAGATEFQAEAYDQDGVLLGRSEMVEPV